MTTPGVPPSAYGERSPHEAGVKRLAQSAAPSLGTGSSRTPLESLEGVITPSSLHFERHHNGVPDLDPDTHKVLIHGLVERPLVFSIDALSRYPLVSRIQFLECAGNSAGNNAPEPPQQSAGGIHGLLSCAAIGPECRSRSCSKRRDSSRRGSGCSRKARTRPA